jgi:hypothetical protein
VRVTERQRVIDRERVRERDHCVESEMMNLKFHSGLTRAGRQHFRLCFCQANFEGSSLTS